MIDEAKSIAHEPTPPHSSGGSAAGRAYRDALARQGTATGTAAPAAPAAASPRPEPRTTIVEARTAQRKKVTGRARLVVPGHDPATGKMVDMSSLGACVLMDDLFPSNTGCVLECDIFHDGQHHLFSVQAMSVYSVLASGKGFKVGFQFGPHGQAASETIAAIVA